MSVYNVSSCLQQCKNYKNRACFSRVMMSNVLPRFFSGHSVLIIHNVTYLSQLCSHQGIKCMPIPLRNQLVDHYVFFPGCSQLFSLSVLRHCWFSDRNGMWPALLQFPQKVLFWWIWTNLDYLWKRKTVKQKLCALSQVPSVAWYVIMCYHHHIFAQYKFRMQTCT